MPTSFIVLVCLGLVNGISDFALKYYTAMALTKSYIHADIRAVANKVSVPGGT